MFTVDIHYLKSSARLEIIIHILQIRKMRLHMVNLLEVTYPLEGRLCWNQIQALTLELSSPYFTVLCRTSSLLLLGVLMFDRKMQP